MNKTKILMIDDDAVFLSAYQKILQEEYEVVTAMDVAQGLHFIEREKPQALLLDISIKNEREGLDILPQIKKRFPHLPVIMVTNWDSFTLAEEAYQKGADYFFIKSQNLDKLKIFLKEILVVNEHSADTPFPVAKSPAMKEILRRARAIAQTQVPVIIYGESGVGKEVVARYIHVHSARKQRNFQTINCAAIPETLLESELFGFEKGAFTGAHKTKKGLIEKASGGTLLLDEIKDLSPKGQASLLRVLEEQELEHLGSIQTIKIDVRIIAASQISLNELVERGQFRSDLYFRLAGMEISIPPLRKRPEDVLALTHYFLRQICDKNNIKNGKRLSQSALLMLKNYHWPGNVRELYHTLESAVLLSKGKEIKASDIRLKYNNSQHHSLNYELAKQAVNEEFEKAFIRESLARHNGNITKTAQTIGLSRQSLQKKIKKYGLDVNGAV